MSQMNMTNELKNFLNDARKELLVRKNPINSINLLTELAKKFDVRSNLLFRDTLALAYFENKDYQEASKVYFNMGELYQAGFCELLLGNIDTASHIWDDLPDSSARSWGKNIISFIKFESGSVPTYLQIRSYLESDLGHLIQANRLDYAENIIKYDDILMAINPETYKFIGKALFNNGYPDISVKYFLKSQKLIPQDAEVYFYLAQYGYLTQAYQETKHMLDQCIILNHHYTPAKIMLKQVEALLSSN